MKICWDNLEGVYLNSKGNLDKNKDLYIEVDSCKFCGEPYLTLKYRQSEFCNSGCSQADNLIDQRFGRLVVKKFLYFNEYHHAVWLCECDCGEKPDIIGIHLKSGNTKSCGCLHSETAIINIRSFYNSTNYSGPNHPRYNPSLTKEHRENGRNVLGYKEWRKSVYELDDHTCQNCGVKGKYLNAHHIEGYNSSPELRTEVSNGITLCEDCHKNFHHQYGNGYNTRAQLIEFLKGENNVN